MTKPIVGLAGGIGSGKSTVARLLGAMGGWVIDADALAKAALQTDSVRQQLVNWWGAGVLDASGRVDRARVADRVFRDASQRQRLEELVHPIVQQERRRQLDAARQDPAVRFIVLDVPLLFEVGLDGECDRVIFVDADREVRQRRVRESRGWDAAELGRREKNQWPLDRKRAAADDIMVNNGDDTQCLEEQVRSILTRILQGK